MTDLLPLRAHVRIHQPSLNDPSRVRYGRVTGYGTVHGANDGVARPVYLIALDNGGDALDGGGWVSILVTDPSVVERAGSDRHECILCGERPFSEQWDAHVALHERAARPKTGEDARGGAPRS